MLLPTVRPDTLTSRWPMSELRSSTIQWRRLLAESAAVVLSILLAFAIDAWWDGHQERRRERELLAGLLADFESSRPDLEHRLSLARRMATGTALFLDLTEDVAPTGTAVVADSLLLALLGGPTYEAATNTLDAAVASGEIELLRSDALRAELATWRRALSDTGEDEREVRRITNEQLVPLLSRGLNLRPYMDMVLVWSGGDPYGAGRRISREGGGPTAPEVSLVVTHELLGVVSLRRFYTEFSAADLQELLDSLDRAVALLGAQLGR